MPYEIGNFPGEMLAAIGKAEDRVARLDEVVRRSPVREGFIERSHFFEAVASMWVAGELVHVEDLVLRDANRDVRTPTHELTVAHSILRARRRIAAAEPGWATTRLGMASLMRRPTLATGAEVSGEGGEPSTSETISSLDEQDDVFSAELAEIDAVLDRSARVIDAAGKAEERKPEALVVGDLVIRDPEWEEDNRLLEWQNVAKQTDGLPATLGAVLLWDAWENLEPLQRQHWLGTQLVNSYVRLSGKVTSHLFYFNLGLKAVPRERRRSRSQSSRLVAGLDAMAVGAELAMKEVVRLAQAREQLERKLRDKRSSSSLPDLVELLMARPIVSSSTITRELNVSHRAALNLVAELGVREVTGRGSYRAWGIL
ncbi:MULTISPECIES: RHE_PE00001 family protein [Rhizobium]|uniref:RHE_PE00001 family protein n=1 Tax=Rhizobium phaseoli TaxID=396 RepID=UPI000A1C0DFF|nr:RHE_PE00001 family protein [Rhizobium phaseoli]ARM14760.1 HTH DNA-binding domain-containing protein [Rhizobium phaseoli Brasil 5]